MNRFGYIDCRGENRFSKKTSISLTQWYPPPGKNSVVSYKDSWGFVVNACVNYQKQIFIGVRDIHPDGQHFQIFCQFEQTQIAINWPFLI